MTLFHHLRCFAKLAQYVSTRLAWERLDPPLRKRLENSFAWHNYGHSRGKIAPDLASPEERAALPPQCWRMAWKNRANGPTALYIASHAYAIEGMELAAAQKLFDDLIDAATAPELSYVHIWRNGTSSSRDHASRSTMVRARGAAYGAHDDLRDRGGLLRAAFAFPAAGAGRSFAPIMVGHCTDGPERSLRCVVTTCQR